jgi:hypothetical protein
MFTRSLLAALVALVACVPAALAGGYATIQVVTMPSAVVAERAFDLEFDVKLHGTDPLPRLAPVVVATSGTRTIRTKAAETRRAGRYAAAVKLPREGTWQLVIESNYCNNKLVLEPTAVAAAKVAAR